MSDDNDIGGTPSLRGLRDQAANFEALAKLRPLLKMFGPKGRNLAEHLAKVPELAEEVARVTGLPDRFNDVFAERGWIAYELLNTDAMEDALALADAGRMGAAEQRLADHYDEQTIRRQLQFMRAAPGFELRLPLAELALADYLEGRYHACVPVVLLILDGLVDDIGKVNRGFFAKDVDLTAWDSMSAHGKGLKKLAAIFGARRLRTNDEPITVPYRHGILHGHDLGYANRLVGAKCWAALFSLRDWAIARRDNRNPEPDETPPTLLESLKAYAETQKLKEAVESWRSRAQDELDAIPRDGEAQDYGQGSPERLVVEFLEAWQRGNYGRMARSLSGCTDAQVKRRAGQLRHEVEGRSLAGFRVVAVRDEAAAISVVDIELEILEGGGTESRSIPKSVRTIYESDAREPKVRGTEGGSWRLVNLDVLW